MAIIKKVLYGLEEKFNSFETTLKNWANGQFSKTSHTHARNQITDTVNGTSITGLPLFAPDFSRKIEIYKSSSDPKGRGFRCVSVESTTSEYNAVIFKLLYPCFIYTEITTTTSIDTDMMIEWCSSDNWKHVFGYRHGGTNYYKAATYRNASWGYLQHTIDGSVDSFLMPLGSVGYWHHYATGSINSNDSGDTSNRTYYIVPAYGTPTGTQLIDRRFVTFTGVRQAIAAGSSTLAWLPIGKSMNTRIDSNNDPETISARIVKA